MKNSSLLTKPPTFKVGIIPIVPHNKHYLKTSTKIKSSKIYSNSFQTLLPNFFYKI